MAHCRTWASRNRRLLLEFRPKEGEVRMPPTVACVVGTRPEVIKMAPVVRQLQMLAGLHVRLVATGQHRELLDRALADFGLSADVDLDLMQPGQRLADLASRAL